MSEFTIESITGVGEDTISLELTVPSEFEAYPGQFVLIRSTIEGNEETSYYTISSPNTVNSMEITVAVDPEGTLGPWLAERTVGETLTVEGPYGNIQYQGQTDVTVYAKGPGIGPAVGIAERALNDQRNVIVVCVGSNSVHQKRLERLAEEGAQLLNADKVEHITGEEQPVVTPVYVFGFEQFVSETKELLSKVGIDENEMHLESFGPK